MSFSVLDCMAFHSPMLKRQSTGRRPLAGVSLAALVERILPSGPANEIMLFWFHANRRFSGHHFSINMFYIAKFWTI